MIKKRKSIRNVFAVMGAVLFLSISLVKEVKAEDKEYQEWLKEKRARQEKSVGHSEKSPFLGSLLAAAVPTAGHLYANQWLRGLPFVPFEAAGLWLIFSADDSGDSGLYYVLGGTIFGISKIWEIVDARGLVKDYNVWGLDPQKKEVDQRIAHSVERYGRSGYKSPNLAFFLSLLFPAGGQTYVGSDGNLLMVGGEILGLALLIGGITSHSLSGLTGIIYGPLILIPCKIWDVWDAHNDATNYNHTLYKNQKTKMNKTNVGLYMPNTNTFGLQLSYHF